MEIATVFSLTARSDEIAAHGYSRIKVLSDMKFCVVQCVCGSVLEYYAGTGSCVNHWTPVH